MSSSSPLPLPSFRNVLLLSALIRIGLIVYSEWHDAHSVVKYTDVDYRVFSDAAAFLLHPGPGNANRAQGPVKEIFGYAFSFGDPYTRETYRYTPLLALLVTPNGWLHPSFGKYLFALCDLINGVLIYQLLKADILPAALAPVSEKSNGSGPSPGAIERQATIYSAIHLLNPLVFSISTRGSSESVLSFLVLLTLYAAMKGRWDSAAILLGLSTHWKIYPIIYGVGCLGVVGGSKRDIRNVADFLRSVVNAKTIRFTLISAATFFLLGLGCYAIWGYPFLYESYLYHLHRLDHRHNFSPYFYLTYLTYVADPSRPTSLLQRVLRSPLTSFVPQMGLALGLGLLFGRRTADLPFAWFVQTVVFVVFNKYFLWYLLLLPLLLPHLALSRTKIALYTVVWVGTQALWLAEAYRLEFLGENVFFGLWARGLVYVVGNCWVLVGIMDGYRGRTVRSDDSGGVLS
ncbi:glycosyltransferase family 50 protein [Hypholoma sublateritium FD-334 SS-4]|uniref:GPI mannosyltransferase 1 n=1 Tax=Hypholoma sublateritium (strain FD-334 SS-4) TaxID=945553 RepID=A0A0D2Q5X2_HYPSF|nr:glycosyltransferase family 50 protein [Hypholoma sublateritium FD-334 SS-4]